MGVDAGWRGRSIAGRADDGAAPFFYLSASWKAAGGLASRGPGLAENTARPVAYPGAKGATKQRVLEVDLTDRLSRDQSPFPGVSARPEQEAHPRTRKQHNPRHDTDHAAPEQRAAPRDESREAYGANDHGRG